MDKQEAIREAARHKIIGPQSFFPDDDLARATDRARELGATWAELEDEVQRQREQRGQ